MTASKHTVFTTTAIIGLMAVLSANAQQPPAKPAMSPPSDMTITGCLRAGPNPSGVPDTTTYTLEPVAAVPHVSPVGGEAAATKTSARYTLTTEPSIQLEPHVGHKIEITGRLKDLSAANTAARPERDPQAKPPQPGGAHNTFEVASMKMVAATCP